MPPEKKLIHAKSGLTPMEMATIRLKCLEPFILSASRHGLEKRQVFDLARAAYDYVLEILPNGIPAKSPNGHPDTAAAKTPGPEAMTHGPEGAVKK